MKIPLQIQLYIIIAHIHVHLHQFLLTRRSDLSDHPPPHSSGRLCPARLHLLLTKHSPAILSPQQPSFGRQRRRMGSKLQRRHSVYPSKTQQPSILTGIDQCFNEMVLRLISYFRRMCRSWCSSRTLQLAVATASISGSSLSNFKHPATHTHKSSSSYVTTTVT